MKRFFISLVLLLGVLCGQAESKLYFEDLKIKAGETKTIELKLQNEDVVKGLQLVLTLSEGLSFVEDEEEEEYAVGTDRCVFISSQLKANGSLGIAGVATRKKDYIAVGDGAIATLLIKAGETLATGTGSISISDVELVFSTNPIENPETSAFDIRIYETCTVSVASADETMGTATVTATEVESGDEVTATATPATGYHFVKWSDDSTDNPYTMTVTGNVTLTALFAPNQYTMTFVLDNGEEDVVVTQDYATELTAPADPTKTGFTFKGWQPEVPATIPAGDMTFTAQWERNKYKLTFIVDGVETTTEVLYEAEVTAPADPEKEGYTFTGWTPAVPETMPAEDVTVTAQFTVNIYAVIYIVDGSEWARDSVAYGEAIELRVYIAEDGYEFSGWTSDEEYMTMPAHDVVYTASITTGITEMTDTSALADVYDMRGHRLYHNVMKNCLRKLLPAGIYIVDGQKVVVGKR